MSDESQKTEVDRTTHEGKRTTHTGLDYDPGRKLAASHGASTLPAASVQSWLCNLVVA